MSRMQRDKGARGEREVCALLRDWGFIVNRTPNSGGLHVKADVTGDPDLPIHVEVKWQERVSILAWIRQAFTDAEGKPSVVFWRTSRMRWRVDVDAELFVRMLAELSALEVRLDA